MSKLRDEFDSAQIEAKWNGYQYILTTKSLDTLEKIAKDLFLDLIGPREPDMPLEVRLFVDVLEAKVNEL